jgi:3-oxoacyl-[acyl-carrier-protein] synthase I
VTAGARAAGGEIPVNAWSDATGRGALVCATTAWNGLGSTPHQIWAFRRAEIAAHAETPFRLRDGQRATMLHIRTLPPRAQGVDRLGPVLRRLLSPLLARAAALGPRARAAVIVSLPERLADGVRLGPGARRLEATAHAEAKAAGLEPVVQSVPRGHAGLAFALPAIGSALAAGQLDAAIVGGIDTYYDAEVVDALEEARRIYDGENLEGFIPGEGGAFLLLARADVARQVRWSGAAFLEAAAFAEDPAAGDPEAPVTGEALTRAIRALCDPLEAAGRGVGWWLSDLTHERDRVREWQLVLPRATAGVCGPDATLELLPPFLGDLGAATLPTAMAIAAEGLLRGDPAAQSCLACASSPGPGRGAVLLSATRP